MTAVRPAWRLLRRQLAGAALALLAALGLPGAPAQAEPSLLFIGNSFLYAAGSPLLHWRDDTVTDLNHDGVGGVPALVKAFLVQAGLDHDVYLETRGGSGLDFHVEHKQAVLGRRGWDVVVMHGYSTLDPKRPGDAAKLVASTRQMVSFLQQRNPQVQVHLMATFPRADQVYLASGAWAGKGLSAMVRDVRSGYDQAAAGAPGVKGVIPVGEAWERAMRAGVADPNPYDGVAPGQLNLWTWDHYHASAHGYYLEALVIFGHLTGRDPRGLGDSECAAHELGFTREQVRALQQVAYEQLAEAKTVTRAAAPVSGDAHAQRCTRR